MPKRKHPSLHQLRQELSQEELTDKRKMDMGKILMPLGLALESDLLEKGYKLLEEDMGEHEHLLAKCSFADILPLCASWKNAELE